jgi:hypothetical protein
MVRRPAGSRAWRRCSRVSPRDHEARLRPENDLSQILSGTGGGTHLDRGATGTIESPEIACISTSCSARSV